MLNGKKPPRPTADDRTQSVVPWKFVHFRNAAICIIAQPFLMRERAHILNLRNVLKKVARNIKTIVCETAMENQSIYIKKYIIKYTYFFI